MRPVKIVAYRSRKTSQAVLNNGTPADPIWEQHNESHSQRFIFRFYNDELGRVEFQKHLGVMATTHSDFDWRDAARVTEVLKRLEVNQ